MRRPITLAAAVVAGLGAALVLALPASAAGVFTSQIDTADPIYPGSALTWSGQHDADGTLTWSAIADGGDPEGVDLAPDCAPTSGTDPVSYSCTLDPVTLAPGGYTLVGQLTGTSSQIANSPQPHFTVLPPATMTIAHTPVDPGGTLSFGGTKLASGDIDQFWLEQGESTFPLTTGDYTCTGNDDASTAWSCTLPIDPEMAPGSYTLVAAFHGVGEYDLRAPFFVNVAEPASVVYTTGPGSLTVSGIPLANVDDNHALRLFSWQQGDEGGVSDLLYNCIVGSPDSSEPYVVAQVDGSTATCVFPIEPGVVEAFLQNEGDSGAQTIVDSYLVFPATPGGVTATGSDHGSGTVAGTGAAGDTIHVESGGSTLCTAIVSPGGAWSCSVSGLSTGAHALSIWEQNVDNPIVCSDTQSCPAADDDKVQYRSGGRSTNVTGTLTITAAATPATTPGATLTTPVWTFSIDGIDTSNLHPGDTFTASGSGLPAGSTVTFVLHSTPVTLGQTVVDPTGAFTFQGTIPLDTTPGAHQIIATLSGAGLASTTNAKDVTVVAAVPASDQEAASGQADQTGSGDAAGSGDKHDVGIEHEVEPNVLTNGLYSIGDVVNHPEKVPAAIAIGLVLLLLGILPAHLLDATLSEQWEHLGRRHPRLARNPGWLARVHALLARARAVGGLAITTATAVLFCFADPRFGFNPESLRLVIALAVALFIVTYVVDWFTKLIVRGAWGAEVVIRLRPLGLVLALLGVIASRVLHFSPGFLIGLVLGLSIAGHAVGRYAWRTVLIRSGLIIGVAIAAWLGFSAFSGDAAEHDFTSALLLELLVAIATEGIVALLVELLPFHLLEGEHVFARSKVLWGALYLVALVVFIVAVVPWEGNWAALGTGLWAWLAVLAAFAIIALTVYVVFRVRSRRHHEVEADERADAVVSLNED